jgi:hypothetical protein
MSSRKRRGFTAPDRSRRGGGSGAAVTLSGPAAKRLAKEIGKEMASGRSGMSSSPKAAPVKAPSQRWIWGPFAVSAIDYLLGAFAGRTGNPLYLLVVAGLPVLVAAVLSVCQAKGRPLHGIDRPVEVAYVAACMVGLAGWSTSAAYRWWPLALGLVALGWMITCVWMAALPGGLPTWAGAVVGAGVAASVAVVMWPMRGALAWSLAWLLGTIPAGAPWWHYRRVRRGINSESLAGNSMERKARQREVHKVFHRIIAEAQDQLPGLEAVTITAAPDIGTAKLKLPAGKNSDDLAGILRWLESAADLRVGSLAVEPDPKERARYAVLHHTDRDPHKETQFWPGRDSRTVSEPLAVGPRADGSIAQMVLSNSDGSRNALVAGTLGSGKSTWENAVIAELSKCDDELSVGIDAKGRGIELGPWADQGALAYVAGDIRQARAMFTGLVALTHGRGVLLGEHGLKKWNLKMGPHITCVADEVAQIQGKDQLCAEMSVTLAQLSRFAQISQINATQTPKMESLGNVALRGLSDIRVAFRHGTEREAGFTLEGYEESVTRMPFGAWCKTRKGSYLLIDGGEGDSMTVRSYMISDEAIEECARERAENPVALDRDSYEKALAEVDRVISECPVWMKPEDAEVLRSDTLEVLRAMAFPEARQAPRHASPARHASAPTAPRQHATEDDVARQVGEVACVDATLTDEELAGHTVPEGMDRESWVATMNDLNARLNRRDGDRFEVKDEVVPESQSITSSDRFQEVRTEIERVRVLILELAGRPQGVQRREVMEVSGRGRTFVSDRLAELRDQGDLLPAEDEHGVWRRSMAPTATDREGT